MNKLEDKTEPTQSMIEKAVEEFTAQGGEIDKIKETPKPSRRVRRAIARTEKKAVKKSGGSRPTLDNWKMLGVKVGTILIWKDNPKITAVVESDVTMQIRVTVGRKKPKSLFGLIKAEKYVRQIMKNEIKKPQGWSVWMIPKGKGHEKVWDRYNRMIPKP